MSERNAQNRMMFEVLWLKLLQPPEASPEPPTDFESWWCDRQFFGYNREIQT